MCNLLSWGMPKWSETIGDEHIHDIQHKQFKHLKHSVANMDSSFAHLWGPGALTLHLLSISPPAANPGLWEDRTETYWKRLKMTKTCENRHWESLIHPFLEGFASWSPPTPTISAISWRNAPDAWPQASGGPGQKFTISLGRCFDVLTFCSYAVLTVSILRRIHTAYYSNVPNRKVASV